MRAALAIGVLGVAIIGAGVYWFGRQTPPEAAELAPLATPLGVTIQAAKYGTMEPIAGFKIPATKPTYADANGMTLYTYDKDTEAGKSACAGDCAKAWPAFAAPADAHAFGDWSVITRDDGSKQWAIKKKPLYRSAKDTHLGDANGNGVDNVWHAALYLPSEGVVAPDGIAAQELLNAGGVVFVNDDGVPLYTFDGDAKGGKPTCVAVPCSNDWSPVVAAELAKSVGDFTVVARDDGIYQWAYKGRPLYTYGGDTVAGDAKGEGVGGKWHVAALERQYIPQGVAIWHNKFGGDNLATSAGLTLYQRDRVISTNTGHNLRAGMHGNPMLGRLFGTRTCDAECTKTWHPLVAPPDAQPSGYWEIATRDDGTKQWMYHGYPVYLFAGDQAPGEMRGNDTYDIMRDKDPFAIADAIVKGQGAMVWHAAIP